MRHLACLHGGSRRCRERLDMVHNQLHCHHAPPRLMRLVATGHEHRSATAAPRGRTADMPPLLGAWQQEAKTSPIQGDPEQGPAHQALLQQCCAIHVYLHPQVWRSRFVRASSLSEAAGPGPLGQLEFAWRSRSSAANSLPRSVVTTKFPSSPVSSVAFLAQGSAQVARRAQETSRCRLVGPLSPKVEAPRVTRYGS